MTGVPGSTDLSFDAIQDEAHDRGVDQLGDDELSEEEFIVGMEGLGLTATQAQDLWDAHFGEEESVDESTFEASGVAQTAQLILAIQQQDNPIMELIGALMPAIQGASGGDDLNDRFEEMLANYDAEDTSE